MPRYTSRDVLRQKLKYAIHFCKSIDTDDYARIALTASTPGYDDDDDSDDGARALRGASAGVGVGEHEGDTDDTDTSEDEDEVGAGSDGELVSSEYE